MRVYHGAGIAGVFIILTIITMASAFNASSAYSRLRSAEQAYACIKTHYLLDEKAARFWRETEARMRTAEFNAAMSEATRETALSNVINELTNEYPRMYYAATPNTPDMLAAVSMRFEDGGKSLLVSLGLLFEPEVKQDIDGEPVSVNYCRVLEWAWEQ